MKKIKLVLSLLVLTSAIANAQEKVTPVAAPPSIGLSTTELLIISLLVFSAVLLLVTVLMFNAFKVMLKVQADPTPYKKYDAGEQLDYLEWKRLNRSKPNVWTKLLELKPMEEETELLIPHSYDGINELNNPVPKWFNYLFLVTVLFAAGYLYYYLFSDYGPNQEKEYETEMVKADEVKRMFLANSGSKFDENSIKIDQTLVENGKSVFLANCIACHGDHGQGIVGPNLTDEFWLHGGSINDIFKTIKYGVPAKGMVSWEKNLSSKNIAEVVNYIISLQGSKPANAKAPQGEKYEPKSEQETVKDESITKN